jgi:hypothetical protein
MNKNIDNDLQHMRRVINKKRRELNKLYNMMLISNNHTPPANVLAKSMELDILINQYQAKLKEISIQMATA